MQRTANRLGLWLLVLIYLLSGITAGADPCSDWNSRYSLNLQQRIGEYQSALSSMPSGSALAIVMNQRISDWQSLINGGLTGVCPQAMNPLYGHEYWNELVKIKDSTLLMVVHAELDFRPEAAKEEIEDWIAVMTQGTKRWPVLFVSNSGLDNANRYWITEPRSPEYLITSSTGKHSVVWSGSEAVVAGGYLGQCHLVAIEDLVRNYTGSGSINLTLPMDAIYTWVTLGGTEVRGLVLGDLRTYYGSNETAFLDHVEQFLNGDPEHPGYHNLPARTLGNGTTSYKITLKIDGVSKRSYGPMGGTQVNIDLRSNI